MKPINSALYLIPLQNRMGGGTKFHTDKRAVGGRYRRIIIISNSKKQNIRRETMLKKLMQLKLGKRIRAGYVLAIALAVFMTAITLIFTLVVENKYHHITTYYAFPQGDIGFAMTILTSTKAYTETIIGYDNPTTVERAIQSREAVLAKLDECLDDIRKSIVTDIGEEHMHKIEETIQAYVTSDEKLFQFGISGDAEK